MIKTLGRRNFLKIAGSGLLGLLLTGSCKENTTDPIEIPIPHSLGTIVEKHIETILKERYAYKLDKKDFFHGHFLFPSEIKFNHNENFKEKVFTIKEYFSSAEGVMYHTRERLDDWISNGNNIPRSGNNVPRSIVGLMDGSIKIPFLESEGYKNEGTIYGTDPYEIEGKVNTRRESTPLINFQGEVYRIWPVFYITPTENGRFYANNERYELSIILKEDPRLTKIK